MDLVYVADLNRMQDVPLRQRENFACASAGAILQNVYLFCASAGLAAAARGWMNRAALAVNLKLPVGYSAMLAQTVGHFARDSCFYSVSILFSHRHALLDRAQHVAPHPAGSRASCRGPRRHARLRLADSFRTRLAASKVAHDWLAHEMNTGFTLDLHARCADLTIVGSMTARRSMPPSQTGIPNTRS